MAWHFNYSFPFSHSKKYNKQSQINILVNYVGRAKVNLDVVNASTDLWRMLVTLIKL
jgi:hypothetical protein